MKLTAEEELWLESYREILSKQFPGVVDQIIVFGSKAKGTATEDSDLDLLLVIRDGDWKVKDAITQPGYLLALDRNAVPSMIVLTKKRMGVAAHTRGAFLANCSERRRGSTVRTENVLDEFARAKKSLAAARLLLSSSLFEDAVSRSYYAVMHATKAALLVHDVIADSHARVRRLFGSVLVRPSLVEKEWAAVLGRQQDKRAVADYAVGTAWGSGRGFASS